MDRGAGRDSIVCWTDGGSDASDGAVLAGPAAGGVPPTIPAAGPKNQFGIAVDATGVYWINAGEHHPGSVMSCPLAGAAIPTTLAASAGSPIRVALSLTGVYWTAGGRSKAERAIASCRDFAIRSVAGAGRPPDHARQMGFTR
jgi:hypothetical protein